MRNNPLISRVVIPVGIIGLAIIIAVTLVVSRPKATIRDNEEKFWLVSVVQAHPRSLSPQLSVYGKIESPHVTRLTAAISADVQTVIAKEGQFVDKDQLLVKLSDADYQLQLKQRQADVAEIKAQITSERDRHKSDKQALQQEQALLKLSEKELERAKSLKRQNLSTQSRIDETEQVVVKQQLSVNNRLLAVNDHQARLAQLNAKATRAEALRDLAALDITRTRIIAPFSGRITSVNVSPGDRVKSGDALLELYDAGSLEIRAQIPTQYESVVYKSLSSGDAISGVAVINGYKLPVVLDRVSGKIIQGSGGLDGLFRVDQQDNQLQLGRTVELKLSLPAVDNAIAVPREAIYGSNRIYRVIQQRMASLDVQRIGEMHAPDGENYVIIKSDTLQAGDRIISTQLPNALDGLLVKVAEEPQ